LKKQIYMNFLNYTLAKKNLEVDMKKNTTFV